MKKEKWKLHYADDTTVFLSNAEQNNDNLLYLNLNKYRNKTSVAFLVCRKEGKWSLNLLQTD